MRVGCAHPTRINEPFAVSLLRGGVGEDDGRARGDRAPTSIQIETQSQIEGGGFRWAAPFENKGDIFSRVWRSLRHAGVFIVQDIYDDHILMRMLDLASRVGEKAHAASTTSQRLHDLFVSTGFSNVEVERVRLTWFWRVMIGRGIKRAMA